MENKYISVIGKAYFMAVAVLMYYFLTEVIRLGVFITFRHAFALVLTASVLVVFLFNPNIARGVASIKAAFVYCIPLLVTMLASLCIWFVGQVDVSVIARGLSSSFIYNNMISFTLAAVAFLFDTHGGRCGILYHGLCDGLSGTQPRQKAVLSVTSLLHPRLFGGG